MLDIISGVLYSFIINPRCFFHFGLPASVFLLLSAAEALAKVAGFLSSGMKHHERIPKIAPVYMGINFGSQN